MCAYVAPYELPAHQVPRQIAGEFLLPVCTTNERLAALTNALNAYRNLSGEENLDYMVDVLRALAYIDRPYEADCVGCTDPEAQCIAYYPLRDASRFEFSPGIINGQDDPPAGYAQHPFFTGDNYTIPGFQLLSTDVIGDGNSFRPTDVGGFIEQITSSGFPRFRFFWTGAATIELHMLKVPFGGSAIIRVDDGDTVDVYDLSGVATTDFSLSLTAILALIEGIAEANFIPIEVIEVDVETEGDHYIDVLFIPELQLSITPIRWGGGVRKVVLCGRDIDCETQKCADDDCGCSDCSDCSDCGCE